MELSTIALLAMQQITEFRVQEALSLLVFVWAIIMRHRGCAHNVIKLVGTAQVDHRMNARLVILGQIGFKYLGILLLNVNVRVIIIKKLQEIVRYVIKLVLNV
jgi:hypothetical protein